MPKPFKFRYVNEIVGGFVIVVLILLIVGVVVAGHAQRWLEPVHKVNIVFPPEGSLDLQKGSEVYILGTRVGAVEQITVAADGGMASQISVRGQFIRFVRADSQAIVRKKFGIAGDAYIEITKGIGAELPKSQPLICLKDVEIMETIQNLAQQFQDATLPAIEQLRKAVEEYTNLAADLRRPEGNLQQLLTHLSKIAEGLEKGQGMAGQVLRDPSMAEQLRDIMAKIESSLADVKKMTSDLEESAKIVKGEMQDVPGVVLQTRQAMEETEKLITAIQKMWLVRGHVEQPESSTLIPPEEVGGTL
jgi:phospholipid/cholesterol/gamma-HCH transport system substrate-binding protein